MPNGDGDFPEFATSVSRHAREIRERLSPQSQLALNKVIDRLAENPDEFPHRIVALSAAENIYLYTHPEPRVELTYKIDRDRKLLYFVHFAVPQFAESKLVFVSYSHKDKVWLDKLLAWLSGFEDDDRVKVWSDSQIDAGDDWREEISNALASARVAVLLVSQDFIASKFIKENELPKLLSARDSGDLKIMWVAIRESAYEDTPIERYQAANDPTVPMDTLEPSAQDSTFKEIYRQIKAALEE